MSIKRTHQISCPYCGREQAVELYDVIRAEEDPETRVALLKGQVNRVTCGACGRSFRIDKPLLYQDRDAGLFLQYDPLVNGRSLPEAEATLAAAQKQLASLLPEGIRTPEMFLVVEWPELIERIFTEEEGLDARLVEHVKYIMYQQNPQKIPARTKTLLFDAQDSTDDQLCFVVQDRASRKLEAVLNFSRADYEALVNIFDSGAQLQLLHDEFPGPYLNARLKFIADQADDAEAAATADDNGEGVPADDPLSSPPPSDTP
ncbi:MAG: CpXC domain-containing protein [Kiritimatiellae bacterium]|nr:CpXC domain-containing protein [Kiritimatiellia bacterium]